MSLILSGSDGLSDIDGSAATPAIRGTDANTGIFFPAADTIAFATGGTEDARFNSAGNLQTIGTISVGNATPSTSGAGITFPAAQSDSSNANTLDDYEEGTFTPAFTSSGVQPVVTYTSRTGTYVKVGRVVTVFVKIIVNTIAGGTGVLYVSGLPFTVSTDCDECGGPVGLAFGYAANPTQTIQQEGGSTVIILMRNTSNSANVPTDLQNNSYFNSAFSYLV
jgi:hypothetical protein